MKRVAAAALVLFLSSWCLADGLDRGEPETCQGFYPSDGPFYSGSYAPAVPRRSGPRVNPRFVSYNVNFMKRLDVVLNDLRTIDALQNPDFILLQEATGVPGGKENGVEVLARALRMNFVFGPAMVFGKQDYGNAILSRWPIGEFRKALLPLSPAENCNQRAAVGATAWIDGKPLQVFSVHLSVRFPDSLDDEASRAAQLLPALQLMDQHSELPTFMSGDFNNVNRSGWARVLALIEEHGFAEANLTPGWTLRGLYLKLDHAFVRGLERMTDGTEWNARGSDHVPIWVRARFAD